MPDRIFVEQTSVSDLRKMAQNVDSDSDLRHCGMRCLCWLSHRKKKKKKGNLKSCEIQRATKDRK